MFLIVLLAIPLRDVCIEIIGARNFEIGLSIWPILCLLISCNFLANRVNTYLRKHEVEFNLAILVSLFIGLATGAHESIRIVELLCKSALLDAQITMLYTNASYILVFFLGLQLSFCFFPLYPELNEKLSNALLKVCGVGFVFLVVFFFKQIYSYLAVTRLPIESHYSLKVMMIYSFLGFGMFLWRYSESEVSHTPLFSLRDSSISLSLSNILKLLFFITAIISSLYVGTAKLINFNFYAWKDFISLSSWVFLVYLFVLFSIKYSLSLVLAKNHGVFEASKESIKT